VFCPYTELLSFFYSVNKKLPRPAQEVAFSLFMLLGRNSISTASLLIISMPLDSLATIWWFRSMLFYQGQFLQVIKLGTVIVFSDLGLKRMVSLSNTNHSTLTSKFKKCPVSFMVDHP
jgi:hypothetical protein